MICPADTFVSDNACTACPAGKTRPMPDPHGTRGRERRCHSAVVGRGHASLLADLGTWHAEPFRRHVRAAICCHP